MSSVSTAVWLVSFGIQSSFITKQFLYCRRFSERRVGIWCDGMGDSNEGAPAIQREHWLGQHGANSAAGLTLGKPRKRLPAEAFRPYVQVLGFAAARATFLVSNI